MQYLNENIKNQYKQRIVESIHNENIQIDEQVGRIVGRIVGRGARAIEGVRNPKFFTPTGKAKPFEYGRRSLEVRRALDGTILEIKDGDNWRNFIDWWQEHLRNLQIGGKSGTTWNDVMRGNQEYLEYLKLTDPELYDFYIKSHMYKNKVYQQVQRYLPRNSRNFGVAAPGIIPYMTDTNETDILDPNSGGWSFDPTTAPHVA